MWIRNVAFPFSKGALAAYNNSGGLSALAGSTIGMISRVYNGFPPHLILEKICTAPRGISESLSAIIATPMKGLSAMSILSFQAIRDWHSLDTPAERQEGQTYSDYQTSRRAAGIKSCLKASLYSVISCFSNAFSSQVLWGMCLSEITSGLAKLGTVGLARTVSVISTASFALLNVGFFAHTVEECQDVGTTWTSFLLGFIVAGGATLANHAFSPLYDRVVKMVNDDAERRTPQIDSPSKRLEESFAKGQDLLLARDSDGSGRWMTISDKNTLAEVPKYVHPHIQFPDWFPADAQIRIKEQLNEPRYIFNFLLPEARSSNASQADPQALEAFYEEIHSALSKETIVDEVAVFEKFLEPLKEHTVKNRIIIIQRGENDLPIWSYMSKYLHSQSPIFNHQHPQVHLKLHSAIRDDVALEISYDVEWKRYSYTLRNIKTAEEVFVDHCRPGCNDGLIQLHDATTKEKAPFGIVGLGSANRLGLFYATKKLSYPLYLSPSSNSQELSLSQYDKEKSTDDNVAFSMIPDKHLPKGRFSLKAPYEDYDILIVQGAYDYYFCQLVDRHSKKFVDNSLLSFDDVVEYVMCS